MDSNGEKVGYVTGRKDNIMFVQMAEGYMKPQFIQKDDVLEVDADGLIVKCKITNFKVEKGTVILNLKPIGE